MALILNVLFLTQVTESAKKKKKKRKSKEAEAGSEWSRVILIQWI